MDIIFLAIMNAPPILRWIIMIPLAFIGVMLAEYFFSEKFKITPFTALFDFIGRTFERLFKYATIGACLAIGGFIVLKFIIH